MRWTPPTPDHLAKLLPQYDIEAMIGRGGMGAVYRARQKSLDRLVAIKILPPDMADEEMNFAERFKNEARTMAKMNHPAIVHVHDFGETTEGQLYIVMEFIDGTDVAKMILAQKNLPAEHALAITAHVCDALQYAHTHGVIHRDIKPANVLINMDGAVKVADFGLAKAMDAGQGGLTQTNLAVGTPDYVAPESLMNGIAVDGRADLYAVGVMLYAMLTGQVPRGSFPLPSVTSATDPRFDKIILKAMEMDREMRYQTAFEIRKDLDVILSTPHVEAGGQSRAAVPKQSLPSRPAGPVAKAPQQKRTADTPVRNEPAAADRSVRSTFQPPPQSKSLGWIVPTAISAVVILGGAFLMRGKTVVITPAGVDEPSWSGPLSPLSGTSVPQIPDSAQGTVRATSPTAPIKVREEPKPDGSGSRQTSDERSSSTASAKPADQTLASSATSSSDPERPQ